MENLFNNVAIQMTETDIGGEAGEQLNITEARQGLKNVLKVMRKNLSVEQILTLVLDYGK